MEIQVNLRDFGKLDNIRSKRGARRYLLIRSKAKSFLLSFRGTPLPGSRLFFINEIDVYEVLPRSRRKKREKTLRFLAEWSKAPFHGHELPQFDFAIGSDISISVRCDDWQQAWIKSNGSITVFNNRKALELARLRRLPMGTT